MRKYTTDPLRTGREIEKADGLGTLGGEFGLCWNDTVPLTTGAHNAFLSAFFEAGGVFDHLVDTCPLRLTSNNAPTNRETLGTAIVGMYADGYEWYALVTDLDLGPRAVSQLYRDRGDCENIFDEMKNHYGWGGFVTQDMKRTAIVAGLSAFVANVWNVFCRIGGDGSHEEALTTRRRLQGCVARISRHGRRNSITVYTGSIRLFWATRSCWHWRD